MTIRRKLATLPLIVIVLMAGMVACGRKTRYVTVACAAEVTEYAQKSSGGSSRPSGGSSSRPSSPAKSSPAKAPTGQNKPSVQNANAKPPSEQHAIAAKNQAVLPAGQNAKSKVTPPGEKSYTPPPADVRPPAKQYDRAAVAAPQRITRGGSYRSPVTNHVYVWHDPSYYVSPGYRLDLFDPYNPWSRTNPNSPFFGMPYNLVDDC